MKCLYITYDGLTDNLGGSQILPYLYGLAAGGHKITILSCEKQENLEQRGESVERELAARGLSWSRLTYHKKPPVLSTVWDVARMAWRAQGLNRREAFDLVHVRSYVPALVGSFLQRVWGLKLLFDMRGFWADERVDGGLWDLRKPVYRMVYRFFKRVERQALKRSDAVISLTQAGCEELLRWPVAASSGLAARLSVIPCCVDLELFSTGASRSAQRGINRESLGIEADDIVCGYLGSIGTWYCLEEMMRFFRLARERGHADRFLFVTSEPSAQILAAAQRAGVPFGAVSVVASRREDVPAWLSLMDYGVFFIRPCYSKISSSATKLGELMAAGLPVISNQGVGDQTAIFSRNRIGHLVRDFGDEELTAAADGVPAILRMSRDGIRRAAETEFSLERGVLQYQKIYEDIIRASAVRRS